MSKAENHCPPAWTDELEKNSNCPKLEYLPLKGEDLKRACYNMLCSDVIKRNGNKGDIL